MEIFRKGPVCTFRTSVFRHWTYRCWSTRSNGKVSLLPLEFIRLICLEELLCRRYHSSRYWVHALLFCVEISTIEGTSSRACESLELACWWNSTAKLAVLDDLCIWKAHICSLRAAVRKYSVVARENLLTRVLQAIDDDDISCKMPESSPNAADINVDFFTCVVRHARLSSLIIRQISTAKAFNQSVGDLIKTTQKLHGELQNWRHSLPVALDPTAAFIPDSLPAGLTKESVLYVRYAYAGSMISIHSIFTIPWNKTVFDHLNSPTISSQVTTSTTHVVESTRSIIFNMNYADISTYTPIWSVLSLSTSAFWAFL